MAEQTKTKLEKAIIETLKIETAVIFAYLFGSFVTSDQYQDIDVAIYTQPQKNLEFELKLENQLQEKVKKPVDVRVLNTAPLPFIYNVIQSGKVIIDKDSDLRADFETLNLKKYFDYVHIRDEYLKALKNAV